MPQLPASQQCKHQSDSENADVTGVWCHQDLLTDQAVQEIESGAVSGGNKCKFWLNCSNDDTSIKLCMIVLCGPPDEKNTLVTRKIVSDTPY